MPVYCGVDFETRSAADLIKVGTHNYAKHHTTEAICCSYIRDDTVYSWWPEWFAGIVKKKSPSPPPWKNRRKNELFTAWHSNFDRKVWNYVCARLYGWPDTEIEDWLCSMTVGLINGLPKSLANAGRVLRLRQQKSDRGKELINLLSIPINDDPDAPVYNEDPETLLEMPVYCDQDVVSEKGIFECCRELYPHELEEYWAAERVNDTGIPVNVAFAREAVGYAEAERLVLSAKLSKITGGVITAHTQSERIKKWVLDGRITDAGRKMMQVKKDGKDKISLDAAVRNNLLDAVNDGEEILTPEAEQVIEICHLANKSSIAKYQKMIDNECGGVIYNPYTFNGAGPGRFTAQVVQPQNMVRDCVKDWTAALEQLRAGGDDESRIKLLARMMRGTIQPEYDGNQLFWADLSSIEARVLPWLCNTPESERKLDLFRDQDAVRDKKSPEYKRREVYMQMALAMGSENMELPNGVTIRDMGKMGELACGFGGSWRAFLRMAHQYGFRLSQELAENLVALWREANSWAESFWNASLWAAESAVECPGNRFNVGRLSYFYTPRTHNGQGTLWLELPSKRLIAYPGARIELLPTPWDPDEEKLQLTAIKSSRMPKAGENKWPRVTLWRGILVQNAVQATAADVLRNAIRQGVKEGAWVHFLRAHTHDELIGEGKQGMGEWLIGLLTTLPDWAAGLPLNAEFNQGFNYGKG